MNNKIEAITNIAVFISLEIFNVKSIFYFIKFDHKVLCGKVRTNNLKS